MMTMRTDSTMRVQSPLAGTLEARRRAHRIARVVWFSIDLMFSGAMMVAIYYGLDYGSRALAEMLAR